jgi:cell division protein FtsB
MTTDQLFYTLTAALFVFCCWTLVKSYVDKKNADLRRHIEGIERWQTDDLRDTRMEIHTKFKDLDARINEMCNPACNKSMSKNYYNSDAGCCKTGPASEYLKG